ncbi:helix-turn-helix transcriptional regulator [Gangjinia marincola]
MKQPELGQKILELRQLKGVTQEELVEQCNISVRTIQRIEAGETMPRMYTIKTILSALDRDLDDLNQASLFETKVKEAMLFSIDEGKDVSFLFKQLHIGWIAGVLSMILFIFEAIEDTYYIMNKEYLYAKPLTITIGVASILVFSVFMRSFILLGNLFKNDVLKYVSILFIAINAVVCIYALIDLDFEYLPVEAYGIIFLICWGMMSLFFGIALLKLMGLGNLPKATGMLQIVIGAMMLTIFLGIVAGPASIIAQGFSVAVILKAIEVIKKQVNA